jgi:UDP-glucose 4-epimerase
LSSEREREGLKITKKDKDKTRIVLVGKDSFIGGALIAQLASSGKSVLGVGRSQVDLLDAKSVSQLQNLVNHDDKLVLVSAIAPCKNIQMFKDNLSIIENLCSALSLIQPKYVMNISSDAVYPDTMSLIDEDLDPAPNTIHGLMHLTREVALNQIGLPNVCHVRPTLVFGPGDPHNGYGPNQFIKRALNQEVIRLYGAGEELRDHIFIDDLTKLMHGLLENEAGGIFNAVSGKTSSFLEITEIINSLFPTGIKVEFEARKMPVPHKGYRAFDDSKLRQIIPGYKSTPLDKALQSYYLRIKES